jgi:predicted HTH transcriptional regulator
MKRIFISSAQKEFAAERASLRDYLRADPLLGRFFEIFLFEDLPAADRRADSVYLDEVKRCDLYIGLFGKENSLPTEQEFKSASEQGKLRLIYVKGADDKDKHPKMRALIKRAGSELIRRRFVDSSSLLPSVYASLVAYLEEHKLILNGPFDAAPCRKAAMKDLSAAGMKTFIRDARAARGFPLKTTASGKELLTHLNLLEGDQPTHAAVLLFGKEPQRFLPASEIKCAHFHGTEVAKPIPSYQVYKGTVFSLVDQAVDFVMSKLALSVGTRAESTQVPVAYEIPREVVSEGIVNAVAHRDYTSNGSVQVMLFADRLEIWNPGGLPSSLTLARLRQAHGSVPHNPLLAEPLYLTKYIERMGTGTRDMIRRCRDAGLPEPTFRITDGFTLIIPRTFKAPKKPRKIELVTTPVEAPVETRVKTPVKILQLLEQHPEMTLAEVAATIKKSVSAVERASTKLVKGGRLKYIGPKKGGHWEVIE